VDRTRDNSRRVSGFFQGLCGNEGGQRSELHRSINCSDVVYPAAPVLAMSQVSGAAFVAPSPLSSTLRQAPRRWGSVSRTEPSQSPPSHCISPRASLVADLAFKAIEVGATTFVTQAVMSQQTTTEPAKTKRSWFGGKRKPEPKAQPSDALASALKAFMNSALASDSSMAHKRKSGPSNADGKSPGSVEALTDATGAAVRSVASAASGDRWVKLLVCVMVDLVGSGSLAVPLLGDLLDIFTAPVTTVLLQALFGNGWITAAGLAEEILPGTDGIPTATLAWLAENAGYLKSGGGGNGGNDGGSAAVGKQKTAKARR
jgi:hypothetical protein